LVLDIEIVTDGFDVFEGAVFFPDGCGFCGDFALGFDLVL
jgi:hypothetical protein